MKLFVFLAGAVGLLAAIHVRTGAAEGPANASPVLALSQTNVNYSQGDGPVVLDEGALVSDPDSPNFDAGTLTVAFVSNGSPEDRLSIRNQGAGAGHIFVSGQIVSYAVQPIGMFIGGTNGSSPLVVTFNGKAVPEAVQALARSITYENVAVRPWPGARVVRLVLSDGDGGVSRPVLLTIDVQAANVAPIALAEVSPLVFLTTLMTNGVVISPNNATARVVLDGAKSSDANHDLLTYTWFKDEDGAPFASGSLTTNTLPVGPHTIRLQVSDGRATGEVAVAVEVIRAGTAVEDLIIRTTHTGVARERLRPAIVTLKAAFAAFERGNFTAAVNQLGAFEKKVNAQFAPTDAALAAELIQGAQKIREAVARD
jgi:hypothetical protein